MRRVGATAGAHPSRLLTAHTVAIGIARGEYSSHSTSIRLMYLSHMTRYTAIRHQPVKPASPTLNQNMESCLPVLLGSYEAATTSGSLMYQATATATAIHNIADSFLKAYSSHVLSRLPSGSSSEEVSGPNGVSSTCSYALLFADGLSISLECAFALRCPGGGQAADRMPDSNVETLLKKELACTPSRRLLPRSVRHLGAPSDGMAATPVAGAVLSKYADHDPSTRAEWISGDLAEETRLPRELVLRLYDMWFARDRPFFDKVSDDGVLAPKDLVEVIRTLKIDDVLLCNSVAGVISEGRPVTFDVFIRGYAALNSRTLRDALPFAFKVFDLDGDGLLGPDEFKLVLEANLKHQGLDAAAVSRVLAAGQGPKTGMDRDQFRYFASQSSETVLASCGFMLKVRDFYVPLIPFGTEEEERQEEEER